MWGAGVNLFIFYTLYLISRYNNTACFCVSTGTMPLAVSTFSTVLNNNFTFLLYRLVLCIIYTEQSLQSSAVLLVPSFMFSVSAISVFCQCVSCIMLHVIEALLNLCRDSDVTYCRPHLEKPVLRSLQNIRYLRELWTDFHNSFLCVSLKQTLSIRKKFNSV